jgi:hypothetical protein
MRGVRVTGAATKAEEAGQVTRRVQRRLRIALPWLESALGAAADEGRALARAPCAEWLVARGRASPVPGRAWRDQLLAAIDEGQQLLRRCPAGPSVRALYRGGRPVGTWACARPVHLLTAIEHLRLAPGDVGIGAAETSTLVDDINRHFQGRGFRFHAQGPGEVWQLECADPIDCSSVEPEDAAGRNVRGLMPGGRDGTRVRSLMNEIQMLLHEHPVNLDRAARGRPAINSLWLWGFGRLEGPGAASLPTLHTDDAWLAGVWGLHGARSRSLDEFKSDCRADGSLVMIACSRVPGGPEPGEGAIDVLAESERCCFAPALAALRSGAVGAVDVLLGGRVIAVESSARLKFWRHARPLAESLA